MMPGERRSPTLTPALAKLLPASLAAAFVAALLAGPATAISPCGEKVIADYRDNGRIDRTYPIQCYRDALRSLPEDFETYSDAPEVIEAAMREAIRQQRETNDERQLTQGGADDDEPGGGSQGGGDPIGGLQGGTGGKNRGGDDGPNGGTVRPGDEPVSEAPSPGVFETAIDSLGPDDPKALPLPIIILGVIALLLIAIGSAGFVGKRIQTRRLRTSKAVARPPTP